MYTIAKAAARYKNTTPSMTDQSQADDTDLNVILRKYGITGKAPGGKQPIPPGDYSDQPTDLRGHIELSRQLKQLQKTLPENLQNLTLEQLARLDNKQLATYDAILTKQKVAKQTPTPETPKPEEKK